MEGRNMIKEEINTTGKIWKQRMSRIRILRTWQDKNNISYQGVMFRMG